jgi:cytochrome c oxidase subunit 3
MTMSDIATFPVSMPATSAKPATYTAPVTPGKVAMWLFLATEVMFFTGLIGSYIVLRAGSPPTAYSDKYSPNTPLTAISNPEEVHFHHWPRPYDSSVNPLSIDLTAANTFILICSSVTMVLALGAAQRDDRKKTTMFLFATMMIGGAFLSVQVYEYYQLILGHIYPIGVSATGHFRPSVSIFASCFFTMTGFHGTHVAVGVFMIFCTFLQSLRGVYTSKNYASLEYIGLYWHFVDLVWIILFTLVYLI